MNIYYTDGSVAPTNPGPGGFAVIQDGEPVVLGAVDVSTNIRMEGMAMLQAILHADGEPCEIRSDSQFWINVLTKWADGWKAKGWKKSSGEIANLDLVLELYSAYKSFDVKLTWVKGHSTEVGNIAADLWANKARQGVSL